MPRFFNWNPHRRSVYWNCKLFLGSRGGTGARRSCKNFVREEFKRFPARAHADLRPRISLLISNSFNSRWTLFSNIPLSLNSCHRFFLPGHFARALIILLMQIGENEIFVLPSCSLLVTVMNAFRVPRFFNSSAARHSNYTLVNRPSNIFQPCAFRPSGFRSFVLYRTSSHASSFKDCHLGLKGVENLELMHLSRSKLKMMVIGLSKLDNFIRYFSVC